LNKLYKGKQTNNDVLLIVDVTAHNLEFDWFDDDSRKGIIFGIFANVKGIFFHFSLFFFFSSLFFQSLFLLSFNNEEVSVIESD
jgi:hypothetical protein